MRFLNKTNPAIEAELQHLGKLEIQVYDDNGEREAIAQAIRAMKATGHSEANIVILFTGSISVINSELNELTIEIPAHNRWQDVVREKIVEIVMDTNHSTIKLPIEGRQWVIDQLEMLSNQSLPTSQDREIVTNLASRFGIDRATKRKILNDPIRRAPLSWFVDNDRLRLSRLGISPWPTEYLFFFGRNDWSTDIPKPTLIRLSSEYSTAENVIRMYDVGQFKGLEAESVILVNRGSAANLKEQIYVAVSRAKSSLAVLIDKQTSLLSQFYLKSV